MLYGYQAGSFMIATFLLLNYSAKLGDINTNLWRDNWVSAQKVLCTALIWAAPEWACVFKIFQSCCSARMKKAKQEDEEAHEPTTSLQPLHNSTRAIRFAYSVLTTGFLIFVYWCFLWVVEEPHELAHCPVEFNAEPSTLLSHAIGVKPGANIQFLCVFNVSEPEYEIVAGSEEDYRATNLSLDPYLASVTAFVPANRLDVQADYTCVFMSFRCRLLFEPFPVQRDEKKKYTAHMARPKRSALEGHPFYAALLFALVAVVLFFCTVWLACLCGTICCCAVLVNAFE